MPSPPSSSTTPPTLNMLPVEIQNLITANLSNDIPALKALALTNRTLNPIAETLIYRDVLIPEGAQCSYLLRTITQKDRGAHRADAIQSISALSRYGKHRILDDFQLIVSRTPNLRALTFERRLFRNLNLVETSLGAQAAEGWGPRMSTSDFFHQHEQIFSMLQRLTLHHNCAEDHWRVNGRWGSIFTLPSLQSLTISRTTFLDDAPETYKPVEAGSSGIKRLELAACWGTVGALDHILSLPRALEELYLDVCRYGARSDDIDDDLTLFSPDCARFISTLAQQRHSLRKLSCYAPHESGIGHRGKAFYNPDPSSEHQWHGTLSNFPRLEAISIGKRNWRLLQLVSDPNTAPPHLRDLSLAEETLEFSSSCYGPRTTSQHLAELRLHESQLRGWCEKWSRLPNLRSLKLDLLGFGYLLAPLDKKHQPLVNVSSIFNGTEITLTGLEKVVHQLCRAPPFFHGQQPPSRHVVFESRSGVVVRNVIEDEGRWHEVASPDVVPAEISDQEIANISLS